MIGRSVTRFPDRVEHGVGDRGGHPDDDQFAEALHADRIGDGVLRGQEGRVECGHVGVDGHQVVGHVGVDDAPVAVVEVGALQQRHADAARPCRRSPDCAPASG